MMNRRHAIALAACGIASSVGCKRRDPEDPAAAPPDPIVTPEAPPTPLEGQSLVPVKVDSALEIRRVGGLRPFRPSGFVVRREDVQGKSLVHNYGHGGGGMSLSWGSAQLAVQLAQPVAGKSCAVIGGGVMGLSTARLLQLQGAHVTLYTRELPPNTTSNVAGAQWWPFSVFDSNRRSEAFSVQYVAAAQFAYDYFQKLVGPRWGVRWLPNYYLSEDPPTNGWLAGPGGVLHHMQIDFHDFGPGEHVFPARYARRFYTMMIEPSVYLNTLLLDVQSAGAKIEVRAFATADEILALPHEILFNCTGIGAGSLFNDPELVPIKGQLSLLLPQPEVDYNLLTNATYMFPRADGIVLGGTYERGQWDPAPNATAGEAILRANQRLFQEMARIQAAAK
jgi:D-amino-acid oxidase